MKIAMREEKKMNSNNTIRKQRTSPIKWRIKIERTRTNHLVLSSVRCGSIGECIEIHVMIVFGMTSQNSVYVIYYIALHLECYYKIICWHSISMKSHQPIKHERNTGLDLIIISHIKEKENASIANFVDKRRKRGKKTVYVFHSSNASPKRYFFLHRSYDF